MRNLCSFALICGVLASATASAQKAVGLKGNPGQFFSEDAYPAEAIRLREEGRVVAKLWIDTTGKVASCTVQTSSGSRSLDQATCDVALEKVVFEPARDRKGQAIAASYMLPVRWALPNGPIVVTNAMPTSIEIEKTYSVDAAGVVTACATQMNPPSPGVGDPCDEHRVGSQIADRWVRDGRPVGATITERVTVKVEIDP